MVHHILTKEEAWIGRSEEVMIPIDRTRHEFQFTRNWFKYRNLCTFSTYLAPRFDGSFPIRMIQIGIFEGMDLVWQLQNTCKHTDTKVIAIDPWLDTKKINGPEMENVRKRALHNLKLWRRKVSVHRGMSQDILGNAVKKGALEGIPSGNWDLIIIDGDHCEDVVYEDAVNSFELAKVGGWLMFDDVRNRRYKKRHVIHALKKFLESHGDNLKQAWSHRYCECYEKISDG